MSHIWSTQQEAAFAWFRKDTKFFQNYEVDVNGHLVLRARAGTGKSTTIEHGAKLIPRSESVLVCAFSKIIQQAMEKRFGDSHRNIRVQTLHSVGLGCIRRFRSDIRVDFSGGRADAITEAVCPVGVPDDIKKLVTKLHTKGREITPHAELPGDLIDLALKFECEPEDEWANSGFPLEVVEELALKAMEFASQIKNGATIDGSDMIFLPVRNRWMSKTFDHVLVDEAQDMTPAQLEIGLGVLKTGGRMCIVGDDRQAIFAFRGADSECLDRLKEELGAAELGLTVTYRCGQMIVDMARTYVPDFEAGPDNPLGEVLHMPTSKLIEMAGPGDFILSRTNAPLVSTAIKLLRSGKRARVLGNDIAKGLIGLVQKLKARSIPDFIRKVEGWRLREVTRLEVQLNAAPTESRKMTFTTKIEGVNDQTAMLVELVDGAQNIVEVIDRIKALFVDDGLGDAGVITCSSVHKAKGLEANRVFVLSDTLRGYNQEELNIVYVAYTRAKQTLVLVSSKLEAM